MHMWSEKNKAQKLDLYFSSLEASTSNSGINSSSIELLGGGHFRKCGRFFESWKRRSYFVYSNSVLIYFENNLPKNIINIDNVSIEDGDENMVQKSGVKRGLQLSRSGSADVNKDDVVSGGQIQEDNEIINKDSDSEMTGIPIILTLQSDCRERVKIVFETLTEAQKFCLLLKCGSQSNNALEFVQRKQWFSVVTAFDEIDTNWHEVNRGYFPIMNSLTKADLHNELSLLQSANQIVLVKLSLLNGVMRKSGITWENPMDLLNESFDVTRSHLVRQHYAKKQRYLEERIEDCNQRLQLLLRNPEMEMDVSREDEFNVNVDEMLAHAQEVLQRQGATSEPLPTPSDPLPPQPPPPPPRTSTKESSASMSPVPSPNSPPRLPTPVVSPAHPRPSSTNEEKIRSLWPSEDDDPIMKPSSNSKMVSRPLSLPHKLSPASPQPTKALRTPERRTSLVVKQHKLSLWRKEIHHRLETSYLIMKKIIPRDIPRFLSPNDQDQDTQQQQFCYHFGFNANLGKRILQKKCLWLITFSDLELSLISREDLEDGGAYALKGQALDIVELSAIYYRLDPLPEEEQDGEEGHGSGSGKATHRQLSGDWEDLVHKIRKKLKYYLTQEENGTLSEQLRRHPAYEELKKEKEKEEIKESDVLSVPLSQTSQRRRGSLRYEEI